MALEIGLNVVDFDEGVSWLSVAGNAAFLPVASMLAEGEPFAFSANNISWSVDQQDFHGPRLYVIEEHNSSETTAEIANMISENILPACLHMQDPDILYEHLMRGARARPAGPPELELAVASALWRNDITAARAVSNAYGRSLHKSEEKYPDGLAEVLRSLGERFDPPLEWSDAQDCLVTP